MKKILKKTGSVLFCLLPVLLAAGIQIIVFIPATLLKALSLLADNPKLLSNANHFTFALLQSMDADFQTAALALYAVIAALVMGFWYRKKFVSKDVPRRKPSEIINLRLFGGLLVLMIGMQYLSTYIANLVALISPKSFTIYEELMTNMGFGKVSFILALYSVIIAPISEELIFRGVTMHYAAKAMPFWVANIFQALLFGLFHGNLIQGAYTFVVGLFCGYVCYRGGSIYLAILYHFLFNLYGTFSLGIFFYTGNSMVLSILFFLLTISVTVAGFRLFQSGIRQKDNRQSDTQQNDI